MTALHEQTEALAIRFGRNLFRLRRKAQLSQEEVAVRAAVHRTEIGLLENSRAPRLDTIVKLLGALEWSRRCSWGGYGLDAERPQGRPLPHRRGEPSFLARAGRSGRRGVFRAAASSSAPADDCATSFAARIGQNLMQARAALGASQELVSDLAALHRTAFGQLERGERIPRTDTLVKLPAALQVEPQSLLAGLIWVPQTVRAGRFEVAP